MSPLVLGRAQTVQASEQAISYRDWFESNFSASFANPINYSAGVMETQFTAAYLKAFDNQHPFGLPGHALSQIDFSIPDDKSDLVMKAVRSRLSRDIYNDISALAAAPKAPGKVSNRLAMREDSTYYPATWLSNSASYAQKVLKTVDITRSLDLAQSMRFGPFGVSLLARDESLLGKRRAEHSIKAPTRAAGTGVREVLGQSRFTTSLLGGVVR